MVAKAEADPRPPAFWRSRMGRRLLLLILAFSSFITLVTTAGELYAEYRSGVVAIKDRLAQIERSYAASLGESLWNLDDRQTELQLRGIADLPDIGVAELRETGATSRLRFIVENQANQDGDAEVRDIPVTCSCDGENRQIGVLHVEATYANLHRDIIQRALTFLTGQAIKTFLVATFILFIVHRLVTSHLLDLSKAMARASPGTPFHVRLRRRWRNPDEVDEVVATFNDMVDRLAVSERRFSELVDALPVGVFEDEPGKGCVYASDLWSKITGLPNDEILGNGWTKAVHPDDLPRLIDIWTGDVDAKRVHKNEFRIRHIDGREFWVMVRALPQLDASGNLRGYIGSITDITERKQMEVALRTSEESFRTLAENLPDMVVRMDRDARFIYATPLVCRVHGHDLEHILGKTLAELSPPGWREHADSLILAVKRAVAEGVANTTEVRWETPTGALYSIITHVPEKNEAGEVVSVLGISRDVTAQKTVEEELRKTALTLKHVITNLPGRIFRMHYPARGPKRLVYLDGLHSEAANPDPTLLSPEEYAEIFHPDDRQALYVELPKQLRESNQVIHVFRMRGADGNYRWRRAWERVIQRDGEEMVTEGISLDITDEMEAKLALEKSELDFRTLAENSPNMIMRYDRECRRIYVNPAYERATGIRRDDALDITPDSQWINVQPPVDEYKSKLRQVMDTDRPTDVVVSWTQQNGTMVSHAVQLVPERTRTGVVTGVLAIGHDITLLKAAERRMQALIDNLPGRTYRVTVRGDGMRRMEFTGGSGLDFPDSVKGNPQWLAPNQVPAHVHEEDALRVATELQSQLAKRDRFELKYRVKTPGERTRWVLSRGRVTSRTDDTIVVDGMMIDVTEEVTAKQALEASERRYRELVDALPVGVFEDEPGKGWVYASDVWCTLTGLSHQQILGFGWINAVHPDDLPNLRALWSRDVGARAIHQNEYRLCHVDGHETWVLVRALPRLDPDGSLRGYVGSVTDISERKAYEASLEHINRVLRTVAAATEMLMVESDDAALFSKMCDVLVSIGNYRMAWIGLAEHDEARTVRPVAYAGIDEGYLESADVRWDESEQGRGPTGAAIRTGIPQINNDMAANPAMAPWRESALARGYRSNVALPLKGEGAVIGCLTIYSEAVQGFSEEEIAILLDLTNHIAFTIVAMRERQRRKEIELHLQQAQKMEALGLLAGSVAHDFNNLLGAIQGFAGFIVEDAKEGDVANYYGQRILLAGKRAKALIGQILSFSRQLDTKRERFALAEVVTETTALLTAAIPTTTQLVIHIEDVPTTVLGNRDLMGQALINLCMNAHDAIGGAIGTVTIVIRRTELAPEALAGLSGKQLAEDNPVTSNWLDENGCAHLASGYVDLSHPCVSLLVSDTGTGMDAAILGQIFTPFFTTKKKGHGTGLGLTAVHRAVIAHQGAILVKSMIGRGTTFEIVLPCLQDEGTAPIADPGEQVGIHGNGERILLVDDDPDFGDMLLTALERRGFEVSPCSDPLEALAGIREFPDAWDALVTDQTMPNMSGLDLIRAAREISPDLACILCTGYAEDALDDRVLAEAGAMALLRKPIDIDRLVAKLVKPDRT